MKKSADEEIEFTWTDGNLTKVTRKYEDGSTTTYTYSYSTIAWPENWMSYWKGTNMDSYLEPIGAWGKMPKNVPTKQFWVYDSEYTYEITMDYTLENGEITKAISQVLNDEDWKGSSTEITTFEWK